MADTICELPRCGRPSWEAYVCDENGTELTELLRRTLRIAGEPEVTISRQSVTGNGNGRASDEARLPFDENASKATGIANNTLETWARLISEERGIPIEPASPRRTLVGPLCAERTDFGRCGHLGACSEVPSIPPPRPRRRAAVLRFLAGQVEWLRHQKFAAEAFLQLFTACRDLAHTVDTHPERVYLGRCDNVLEDGSVCPEDLYALAGRPVATCRGCGSQWGVEEQREWLLGVVEDRLATATDIARALSGMGKDVKLGSIQGWASKGELLKHPPLPGTKSPLYRVGDVLDLVARKATRRHPVKALPARCANGLCSNPKEIQAGKIPT